MRTSKSASNIPSTRSYKAHSGIYKLDISPVEYSPPRRAVLRPASASRSPGQHQPTAADDPSDPFNAPSPRLRTQYLVWPRAECAEPFSASSVARGRVSHENAAAVSAASIPRPTLFFEGQPAEVAIPKEMLALTKANRIMREEHTELLRQAEAGKAASAAAKLLTEQLQMEQAACKAARSRLQVAEAELKDLESQATQLRCKVRSLQLADETKGGSDAQQAHRAALEAVAAAKYSLIGAASSRSKLAAEVSAMPHRGSARPSLFMLNTDWAGERLQGRRAVAEAAQGWRLAELLRGSGLELEDLLAQALVRDARTEFEEGD